MHRYAAVSSWVVKGKEATRILRSRGLPTRSRQLPGFTLEPAQRVAMISMFPHMDCLTFRLSTGPSPRRKSE